MYFLLIHVKHNPLEDRDQELFPYILNVENLALISIW